MTLEDASQEEGKNVTAEHAYRRDLPGVILALRAKSCLETMEILPKKGFQQGPWTEWFGDYRAGGQPQTRTKRFGQLRALSEHTNQWQLKWIMKKQ